MPTKPTLGVYGPGPDDHSGVSRYIRDSLPWLGEAFDVTWVHHHTDPDNFDLVLYHLGNNRYHHGAFRALRARPGPAILHEFNTFAYYLATWPSLDDHERTVILALLGTELGTPVQTLTQAEALANRLPPGPPRAWDIGVERLALEHARPALVHSAKTHALLAARHPSATLAAIPLPVTVTPPADIDAARDPLDIPRDQYVFGLLGFTSAAKHTARVVEVWQNARLEHATLLIAGEDIEAEGSPIPRRAVHLNTYLPDDAFDRLLDTVDCGIHLRNPSMGETSGVVAALLARGKTVIVSDAYGALAPRRPHGGRVIRLPIGARDLALRAAMESAAHRGRPQYRPDHTLWARWRSLVVAAVLRRPMAPVR